MRYLRSKRARALVIALLLVAALAFLTRARWLPLPAQFLIVNQPLEKADAVYVLGGFDPIRAPAAADLFRAGYAPKVLVSAYPHSTRRTRSSNDGVDAHTLLLDSGIPVSAVAVVGTASTTYQEAINLKEYLRAHPVRFLIIVTSHFHSRRVQWTFRRVLAKEIKLIIIESDNHTFHTNDWWQQSYSCGIVFKEYTKLIYYGLRYRF